MVAGARTFGLDETFIEPQVLSPPPTRHALLAFLIALAAVLHIGTAAWGDLYGRPDALYAESAREMLQNHQPLLATINGLPRPDQPPLLHWLLIASFKIFGVNTMAARLPAAVAMIASVAVTFLIGERLADYCRGFAAGLLHLCSSGAFLLGRVVMPEPVFSAFVAGAILCAVAGYQRRRLRRIWFSGFWVCCAQRTPGKFRSNVAEIKNRRGKVFIGTPLSAVKVVGGDSLTTKAKRRNSFWTVAPNLMWLLSSPQQPRGWKDSPTI